MEPYLDPQAWFLLRKKSAAASKRWLSIDPTRRFARLADWGESQCRRVAQITPEKSPKRRAERFQGREVDQRCRNAVRS